MIRLLFMLVIFLSATAGSLYATEDGSWPRDVQVDSGIVTVYEPQVDSLQGDTLKGRAAVAYIKKKGDAPVFGATWFTGKVSIDRNKRLVSYRSLEMTEVRFPERSETVGQELAEVVRKSFPTWNLTSTLDSLMTSLAASESEAKVAAELKNDPPAIVYRDHPALLVSIDGKEQLQAIENSGYESVINTPYPLMRDTADGSFHLNAAKDVWYTAKAVDGPWVFNTNPPAELLEMVEKRKKESDRDPAGVVADSKEKITADNAPEVIVVHEPTELVVSEGRANFILLTGDLLAMSNTDTSVFMDVKEQQYYMVVSGRWYKASSMGSQWQYVESDSLPDSFADIPDDSSYADLKAYVAGTDEAREAVMDAQIPQTAAVKRETVDIELVYDGEPEFKKVDGTSLQFAVNCSETVIKADKDYYLVKEAVWYLGDSPKGPWVVSDHAPPGIDSTKPSSPVYNTKYVYVYDSTPDVVYVGYTPGYLCSYVYGPTIVYGTGWYYRPWVTPYYYYPRHATWGFSVSYNSWTGWGFGLSWNSGPFHFGFYNGGGWHRWPWYGPRLYGPAGYRPGIYNYRRGDIHIRNDITINNYRNFRGNNLYSGGHQLATIWSTTNLISIDRNSARMKLEQMKRNSITRADIQNRVEQVRSQGRPNNVYTDKEGNIYRNNKGSWQQHTSGKWSDVKELAPDRLPAVKGTSDVARDKAVNRAKQLQSGRAGSTASVTRPSNVTASRPTARPSSGYSRPSSVQRQSHARARARSARAGGARR